MAHSDLPDILDFQDEEHLEPATSGLYLLYAGAELVYVGQSSNIGVRIVEHQRSDKAFNTFRFYPMPDLSSRLRAEGILILKYLPKYNRALNLGMSEGRVWEIRWRAPSSRTSPRRRRK